MANFPSNIIFPEKIGGYKVDLNRLSKSVAVYLKGILYNETKIIKPNLNCKVCILNDKDINKDILQSLDWFKPVSWKHIGNRNVCLYKRLIPVDIRKEDVTSVFLLSLYENFNAIGVFIDFDFH